MYFRDRIDFFIILTKNFIDKNYFIKIRYRNLKMFSI